ncbi:MAG: hypothetical protein ABEI86_10165, partial [Halobacteriaceae archaeon]
MQKGFEQEKPTLVEALPAMGKSYGIIKWAKESGSPLSVFTSREQLFDQYEDWCDDWGLSYRSLPAFHRACNTIDEDADNWEERGTFEKELLEVYNSGISGAQIHENPQRYFGQQLPCQEDGPCPYMEKREFDPDAYDVLFGHYLQAHNRKYIEDRYVAF